MTSPTSQPTAEELLTELTASINRFVVLSRSQADVCALWILHTHAIDAADFTPYLNPTSPVKRSGKTRLVEVLRLFAKNPWYTGRVTSSALVRKTDKEHPTLLLDESDATFQTKGDFAEVLRGILNTGFEREGTYSMSVPRGQDWIPKDFNTFSPKVIAGIGRLPATIEDRSIPIRLKRARPDECRERFRKAKVRLEAEPLKRRIEVWAASSVAALRTSVPALPDQLNDRQCDVCEPLLAIADMAGGEWAHRARTALVEVCASDSFYDESAGYRLLSDIRDIFYREAFERVSTARLLDDLSAIEDAPWAEFDKGRRLSAFTLSQLLRPFDVRPRDIRFGDEIRKGYRRQDLEETWERYLPSAVPPEPVGGPQHGQQASIHAVCSDFSRGQHNLTVAPIVSTKSSVNKGIVADVAPSASGHRVGNFNPGDHNMRDSER